MPNEHDTLASLFGDIADSIRAKTGESGQIVADNFPDAISSIPSGGGATEPYIEETYDSWGTTLTDVRFVGHVVIRADAYTSSSVNSVTIEGPVEVIDQRAFSYCTNLETIDWPDSIYRIEENAFYGCSNLVFTDLPADLSEIRAYSFDRCSSLEAVSIPSGVTKVYTDAFAECTGLRTVTFTGTPTTLHKYAFRDCTNISTINVPWYQGYISGAPWGATNATINYNYTP